MTTAQPSLLPENRPKGELRQLDIGDIEMNLAGPEPDSALKESVKRLGVLVPVVVVTNSGATDDASPYLLVDGRRRILSSMEAGIEAVPAYVFRAGDLGIEVSRLSIHATVKRNHYAEFRAIQKLEMHGYSVSEIARTVGMPVAVVKQLMTLADLKPVLLNGLQDGKISPTVALKLAKLDDLQQTQAESIFLEAGRLTEPDIKAIRTVKREANLALFDFSSYPAETGGERRYRTPGEVAAAILGVLNRPAEPGLDKEARILDIIKEVLDADPSAALHPDEGAGHPK